MKKIATAWNFIYYSICIFTTSCFKFINKINIFSAFTNTANFKKKAKKNGIDDFSSYIENMMNNEKSGQNIHLVNIIFNSFSALFFTTIFFIINIFTYKYLRINLELSLLLFVVPAVIFINYKTIYKYF